MGTYQGLDDWVGHVGLAILQVEGLEGDGFEVDFTGASLAPLERLLPSYFVATNDISDPEQQELADGVAGYLGEVLMRLAGGAWGWDDGEPFVHADDAVGLATVYPLRILARAVADMSGHEFSDVYTEWSKVIGQHRLSNPDWRPEKKRTPGVDPVEMSSADAAYIATWVAERRSTFEQWTRTYGPDGTWDFGPESLDTLESLLLQQTPLPKDLRDPAHREFVQGAAWYLGEVVRRIGGGDWVFRTMDPKSPSIYAGDPCVQQLDPDGRRVKPVVILRDFVRNRVPGTLREEYARWLPEPEGS
ncbi:hypothetical protein [Nocardia macrotermitis]|uniref:Uncharacterized protein n=1 Tax=Nocardia macrotermitis TaxID=2585198 RepID=A0A7K0DAL6_9NOCA|nr:hypothetical protein [Nocardia macrotermitis]MQY22649.1 hypothetical protein [Nocardia macrotermitis]